MLGEEIEELADVAGVGLQRFRRHAPLGAEIAQPAADFGCDVGGGKGVHGGQSVTVFFTLP
jgi:hypothetical protein